MALRNYTAKSTLTNITTALSAQAGGFADTVTVASTTNLPAAPFTAGIEMGTANEELVLVTAVNTGTGVCNITRGYDSTNSPAHASGAGSTFQHAISAVDYAEANAHVNATSGVHGATGALVDVGSDQTITGAKTYSSTTDGQVRYTGGTADSTTFWYADIGGTQKHRAQRDGTLHAAKVTLHGGGDVLSGAVTFSVDAAGVMNAASQVQENGSRVYSAANPNLSGSVVAETTWGLASGAGSATTFSRGDHTHGTQAAPATSVAGRTGAVTLTAADIGAGTFPTGTFTFQGTVNAPSIASAGSITASGSGVFDNGTRVFSAGNPPATTDIIGSLARGLVQRFTNINSTAAISASTNVFSVTVNNGLVINRYYRVTFFCYGVSATVATDNFEMDFTLASANALSPTAHYFAPNRGGNTTGLSISTIYQASATTTTATLTIAFSRQAGTGTVALLANSLQPLTVLVEDIGS